MIEAKKILVTGNAGSGKTTLAQNVSKELGLDYYTLDSIVWRERWQKTPAEERDRLIAEVTSKANWVIDGVDNNVLKQAELVVFLDVPRRLSYFRVLKRNPKYLFKSRPGLPPHCPEILIIPRLIKIIHRFPTKVKPKILAEKTNRQFDDSFIHITSKDEYQKLLNKLA